MNLAEQFRAWVFEPGRTNDELYTVELLVEEAWTVWLQRQGRHERMDWEAKHAHSKERLLNPAYRAHISREKIDALVEVWAELRRFSSSSFSDRPLGEVDTLRFFPQLTSVSIDGRFGRIDALAGMRGLTSLSISGEVLEDLGPLRGLPALTGLHLSLRRPWPDLTALNDLPALRTFHYRGNPLALRDVRSLPAVYEVQLNADFHWKTPLRDLRDLPDMPSVRHMQVESVGALTGVERFPVCNLQLEGPFADLAPLAAAGAVTWLRLQGQAYDDLRPLARMPVLRELRMERELPLDLSPLADAPRLREARVYGCDIVATELAAINALLPPWADDFFQAEPVRVPPVRFFAIERRKRNAKTLGLGEAPPCPRPAFYGDDRAYAGAEARWFDREVRVRLDALLKRGWRGRETDYSYWTAHGIPGHTQISITRYEDVLKLREVVRTLHALLHEARFPWEIQMFVEPHGNLDDDMAEIAEREDDDEAAVRRERDERKEFRRGQEEQQAFLERQHRLRLQQEQGLPIDPRDFAPPPDLPEEPENEDAGGGIDTARDIFRSKDNLGAMLSVYLTLSRTGLWVTLDEAEPAADYYGEHPENWHKLPEPPEERPRPAP